MTLAEKILRLRNQAGMSQEELALRLDTSKQSVSDWEAGSKTPELEKLLLISNLFGISTDALLKDNMELPDKGDAHTDADGAQDEQTDRDIFSHQPDLCDSDAELAVQKVGHEPSDGEPYTVSNPLEDTSELALIPANEVKYVPAPPASEVKKRNSGRKKKLKVILTVAAILIIAASAVAAAVTGTYGKIAEKILPEKATYPYVLVHGFGGWGSSAGINDVAPYWGASTGSLSEYLTQQGYTVCEPTVGPVSSAWDRACELYAQLTGTTVDYGESHSTKNGHERYGRTYTQPLVENWGKGRGRSLVKVNLVGHSFGGNTIRLLAHLLQYGDEAERSASGNGVSPLFEGGHGKLVNSVTTLCSPSNGSTLYYVMDKYDFADIALRLFCSIAGLTGNDGDNTFYDFQLEQFGITSVPGEQQSSSDVLSAVEKMIDNGTDNAVYDLSPDGAAKLNDYIQTVPKVYYFSYTYCTTTKSLISSNEIPVAETLTVLKPTAILMGRYSQNDVTDYVIDKTWLPNDGLVNVVSAKYPFDEEWVPYSEGKVNAGIWNVMPVLNGDHGTVIGLEADAESTHAFYVNLFTMIDSLR